MKPLRLTPHKIALLSRIIRGELGSDARQRVTNAWAFGATCGTPNLQSVIHHARVAAWQRGRTQPTPSALRLMKTALFLLLALSAQAATLDLRRAPTEADAWRMAREYAASVPTPRIWSVASTGSMWPLVRGGDIVVMQAGFPKPGEIGAFHYVPSPAERAIGQREGYRMHEYVGTENGYAIFTPSVTPSRPYPIRERVPVSEVIGVIRVSWRAGK